MIMEGKAWKKGKRQTSEVGLCRFGGFDKAIIGQRHGLREIHRSSERPLNTTL